MTYAYSGFGAYYADTPGFQLPNEAAAGFGAIDFAAESVWSDVQKGSGGTYTYYPTTADKPATATVPPDNAAGRRAANRIRAALAQLGFGPDVRMDEVWGSSTDCAAYGLFLDTMGVARVPGGVCGGVGKAQLQVLEELIRKQKLTGETPGPLPIVEYHDAGGGTFIKGPAPGQKPLGSGGGLMLLLLAAAAVGGVYLLAKSGSAHKTTTVQYVSNRRRSRHYKYQPKGADAVRAYKRGYASGKATVQREDGIWQSSPYSVSRLRIAWFRGQMAGAQAGRRYLRRHRRR